MNQLKAIEELAEMISSQDLKRLFICEWLEDINWHSECAELSKGYINPNKVQKMRALTIARNKPQYTAKHYLYLLENGIVSEQDEEDNEKLRQKILVFGEGYKITHEALNDFKFALECAKSLSLVYGWGMENEIDQKTLIPTLEAIITKKDTVVRAYVD